MDIQEVLNLLNRTASETPRWFKDKKKKWTDVYYDISLHTTGTCPWFMPLEGTNRVYPTEYICEEYQWRFNNRLMNRHPNEPEGSRWYRYSIYRPLTKAPFNRAIQVISGAIFQDSNYNVTINDRKDNEYIWGNNFEGHDLIGYFANIGFRNIVEDPNGWFIRMPDKPYYEQTEDRVTVVPHFINTKDLFWLSKDEVIFRTADTKYAYWVDKQSIWRFTRDFKANKYIITPEDSEGYYAHMLGYLPITIAGGEWNTHGFFDSYLDAPKALCDEFISTFSAAQVVDKEASHPYIQAVREDCPHCQATGQIRGCKTCGNLEDKCRCEGDYTRFGMRTCGSCRGTGYQSVNPLTWIRADKNDMDKDLLKYISPDIGINKHHREVVKELNEQILQALHLYRTDKAESGEAKAIDQEWLYQFLSRISNHVFDKIIYDTIRDFIAYRNVRVQNGAVTPNVSDFVIVKPTQFRIKTAGDLLEDYKIGKEAGLPTILREQMAIDFGDKAYSGNDVMKKKLFISKEIDGNFTRTVDELMSLRTMGLISSEEAAFSVNLPNYLNRAIEDKGEQWFLRASVEDIETQARSYLPPINTLINGLSQGQG